MKSLCSHLIKTLINKKTAVAFVMVGSMMFVSHFGSLPVLAEPTNDLFSAAQVLSPATTVVTGTIAGATTEVGEYYHALQWSHFSVWYKYTAPGNGVMTMDTVGSDCGTLLAVYQGTNINNIHEIVSNDDYPLLSNRSRVIFGTVAGQTYYVAVDYDRKTNYVHGDIKLNYVLSSVVSNDNFTSASTLPGSSGRLFTTTNVGASKEFGEPNHAGNSGGKSVWFKWTAPAGYTRPYQFVINSASANAGGTKQTLFAVYKGASVSSLTEVGRGKIGDYSKLVFSAVPGTTYYLAFDGYDAGSGASTISAVIEYSPFRSEKTADFDHDGNADTAVFRPVTGAFYSRDSIEPFFTSSESRIRSFQWGTNGDKPMIGDNDADGEADFTVFRPNTGKWYAHKSANNSFDAFNWGINTDVPMLREKHTLTGRNDVIPTVFRASTGTWYSYLGSQYESVQWGTAGDIPVLADFDGDGIDDFTVYRPSTGIWYILLDQATGEYRGVQFGTNGDRPVPADYDGDGKIDIAVFRPSTGVWYIQKSSNGQTQATPWGVSTDKVQPADYDGDGKADIAIFRNGIWWVINSSTNNYQILYFGAASDIPVTTPIW